MGRIASIAIVFALATISPAAATSEHVLLYFTTEQYGEPIGRLVLENGSLFGTASGIASGGPGMVFKLTPHKGGWIPSIVWQFNGGDGDQPEAGLLYLNGGFFGTTYYGGGPGNVFVVYKKGGAWLEKTAFQFSGADGVNPACDLIADSSGDIYGTTSSGVVFELSKTGGHWTESAIHVFSAGAQLYSGLLLDKSGALYGTTTYGGKYGDGSAFELIQSGGTWREHVLHNFAAGADGNEPVGTLVEDSVGSLYGATWGGGGSGYGTVFELSRSGGHWKETTLYRFAGGGSGDGANPNAGLTWSASGSLYGTTYNGGAFGKGTVYELTPAGSSWTETVLYSFGDSADAANPASAVALDSAGNLYGTSFYGGPAGYGTVWELTP